MELSINNQIKVAYITDIDTLTFNLFQRHLTVDEFDQHYDLDNLDLHVQRDIMLRQCFEQSNQLNQLTQ
jgi:hypothetical protein